MQTTIEWTTTTLPDGTVVPGYTFNPWWGCEKVSAGCKHCYAETFSAWLDGRGTHWGPGSSRKKFGDKHWNEPLKWNAYAQKLGVRLKVFCASMADVMDDHPDVGHERMRLWQLIEKTPYLNWLILTKRPENFTRHLPQTWVYHGYCPKNIWLGTTAENHEQLIKRAGYLMEIKVLTQCPVIFLSCEPLLGNIRLATPVPVWGRKMSPALALDWVIVGGESGPGARVMDPVWVDDIRLQCAAHKIPFFFKQWGEYRYEIDTGRSVTGEVVATRVGKKAAGALLGGREYKNMPKEDISV